MKTSLLGIAASLSLVLALTACESTTPKTGYYSNPHYRNTYSVADGDDIIGKSHTVKVREGETLSGIASRYDVGVQEMKDANPHVNFKKLTVGDKLTVPSQYILPPKKYRNGIVINVAEMRLYYFSPNGKVSTYPVALGREKWRTPAGTTSVVRKETNPSWRVPASIRKYVLETEGKKLPSVVPPGEDNPLGKYALYLGRSGYLIHGTNAPASIGRLVSSGCIRMYNEDVRELYYQVQPGTPVHIVHYPNKAGMRNGKLYVESHKPIKDSSGGYQSQTISMERAIQEATNGKAVKVNKSAANNVRSRHNGAPTVIGVQES